MHTQQPLLNSNRRGRTSNHGRMMIYMIFLTNYGQSHDIAADIAGWAELASVGEECECDGATIIIVD